MTTETPLRVFDVHHTEVGPVAWDPRTTRVVARDPKDAEQYVPTGHRILSVVAVPSDAARPVREYEVRHVPPLPPGEWNPTKTHVFAPSLEAARRMVPKNHLILSVVDLSAPPARDALVRLVATALDGRRPADPDAAMALHSSAAERVVTALEDHPLTADMLVRLIPVRPCEPWRPGRYAAGQDAERGRVTRALDTRIRAAHDTIRDAHPGSWRLMRARQDAQLLRDVLRDVLDPATRGEGSAARIEATEAGWNDGPGLRRRLVDLYRADVTDPPPFGLIRTPDPGSVSPNVCPRCHRLKAHAAPFPGAASRCDHPFHSDGIPPARTAPSAAALDACGDPACPVHGNVPLSPQGCHGNRAYCSRCSPRRCPSWPPTPPLFGLIDTPAAPGPTTWVRKGTPARPVSGTVTEVGTPPATSGFPTTAREWRCTAHGRWVNDGQGPADEPPRVCLDAGCNVARIDVHAPAGVLRSPVVLPPEHVPPGVEVEVTGGDTNFPRKRRRRRGWPLPSF